MKITPVLIVDVLEVAHRSEKPLLQSPVILVEQRDAVALELEADVLVQR